MQNNIIPASGIRFHRLYKIRDAFLTWRTVWRRKRELMKFEDCVQSKGNKARKQRIFTHWKHCIFLDEHMTKNNCSVIVNNNSSDDNQRQATTGSNNQQQQPTTATNKQAQQKPTSSNNNNKTILNNHILLMNIL